MLKYLQNFFQNNLLYISLITIFVILLSLVIHFKYKSSLFSPVLKTDIIDPNQVREFPELSEKYSGSPLEPPIVPEEIGLSQKYPQGQGVSMNSYDSNSFTLDYPGPLLTDYSIPDSYGESSLADPLGNKGAGQGSRIIKLINAGDQLNYKPLDISVLGNFAEAYSDRGEVSSMDYINNSKKINYSDTFNPENNLMLTASPGQKGNNISCEATYPRTVKYKNFCITEGDIPYGEIVNGKVNPRLLDRWQSLTGNYSRETALSSVDGLLYPTLGILSN